MAISWQIPRNCLAWLLAAQFFLLLPHLQRLPWWVLIVYLTCAVWRVQIYQGRWSLPPKYIKVIMAALCFAGIYQSYRTLMGLEPTVALLLSGFCLKLLEVGSRRDMYLLIFLAYFVAATSFLFSQTLWMALFILACLMVITAALVALHQHDINQFSANSLKKALVIFAQAVPLMVVLFLVFPRLGPLWSVPMPSGQAKTGMSEAMSPGDISKLGLSDELVFRVVFEQQLPPRQQLYWRGLVLTGFDGRTWSPSMFQSRPHTHDAARDKRAAFTDVIRYRVIQEPTQQHWTFTIPAAYSDDGRLRVYSDDRIVAKRPIRSRMQFDVESDPALPRGLDLDDNARQYLTRLRGGNNEKSRAYAQQLRLQSDSEQAYINRVLAEFRNQPFYYTLKPPLLGDDPVDEFLFSTRRGFCEHFASSFVFLMRAAGIPARVVAGYQGGEFNPINNTLTVRQYDAHAWAEVWLPERGWQRVDPTAAVAPQRIELGLEQALAVNQEEFLADSPLSPHRYRNIAWMRNLLLQLDVINYRWTSWVLNYEGQNQYDLLSRLLGKVTPLRVATLVLVTGLLMFLVLALQLLKGARSLKPEQKTYLSMCQALARAGFERRSAEGPIDFARRVAAQNPAWKSHLLAATRAYVQLSFEALPEDQRRMVYRQLRAEVLRLRYRLRFT